MGFTDLDIFSTLVQPTWLINGHLGVRSFLEVNPGCLEPAMASAWHAKFNSIWLAISEVMNCSPQIISREGAEAGQGYFVLGMICETAL